MLKKGHSEMLEAMRDRKQSKTETTASRKRDITTTTKTDIFPSALSVDSNEDGTEIVTEIELHEMST